MNFILDLIVKAAGQTWLTFLHNWPYLVLSVALAALLKLYLDPTRVSAFLLRHQKAGVLGATTVAVATPLCSCGTTAIVLGMIASLLPWAPVVAFMVASPLTSPQELVYSAGLFGWPFALAFFAASILLGLLGGAVAGFFDRRGWLKNQARLATSAAQAAGQPQALHQPAPVVQVQASAPALLRLEPAGCGCETGGSHPLIALSAVEFASPAPIAATSCGCSAAPAPALSNTGCDCTGETPVKTSPINPRMFLEESFSTGKRLLVMFLGFAFIGYFLNGLIPPAWVAAIFGGENAYSVLLAATLGLPLYINTEASLPLVRAMLDSGMSQGAALAFLITGAGTSFGAVGGMLTIARWRVVALVIGTLWAGGVLAGTVYNLVF